MRDRLNWSRGQRVGGMSLDFSTTSSEFGEKRLHGALAELENAVLAIFWEGERPRLGSMAVTLPGRVSSQLLGERDQMLARLIGEQLSARFGKMVIVSINLSLGTGGAAGRLLLEMAMRLAEGREEEHG